MKKRTAGILLGAGVFSMLLTGCGGNKATEAVNESVETEKEGNGKDAGKQADQEEKDAEEGAEQETEPAEKVGVLLASGETDGGQAVDGITLEKSLTDAGYAPEIRFAGEDAQVQISQIQELLQEEVSALVIAPVDIYALPEVLEEAKEKEIPVFSYDKLIMDTDAVTYYTAFDTRKIGHLIGNAIVDKNDLNKAREEKRSLSIEFLMGSPDDGSALFIYNGIMEVLGAYLEDGTLVCRSQKTSFDDTAIIRWSRDSAKEHLSEILDEFYGDDSLDILCTAYDLLAAGGMEALEAAEITSDSEAWPYITGVGSVKESVVNVADGRQAFTIFLDHRSLAVECSKMVDTYLKGENPEVKDYEQYDNGKKIIGTYTCDAQLIDKDNYRLLIDNGFYAEEEILPLIEATPTPQTEEAAAESEEAAAEENEAATDEPAEPKTETAAKNVAEEKPEPTPVITGEIKAL